MSTLKSISIAVAQNILGHTIDPNVCLEDLDYEIDSDYESESVKYINRAFPMDWWVKYLPTLERLGMLAIYNDRVELMPEAIISLPNGKEINSLDYIHLYEVDYGVSLNLSKYDLWKLYSLSRYDIDVASKAALLHSSQRWFNQGRDELLDVANVLKLNKKITWGFAKKILRMDRRTAALAIKAGKIEDLTRVLGLDPIGQLMTLDSGNSHKQLMGMFVGEPVDAKTMPNLLAQLGPEAILGVGGKATKRLFLEVLNEHNAVDKLRWASQLAYGNADKVQRILQMEDVIPFVEESVSLVKSLGDKAIRLIGNTTIRVRGDEYRVTYDIVSDSGTFWNNLRVKPNLGRARCWHSIHELIYKERVRQEPNYDLKVNYNWAEYDGKEIPGVGYIELPKNTSTLKEWGHVLKHCVGGYGDKINKDLSVILGVMAKNGEPLYTLEVQPHSNWGNEGDGDGDGDYMLMSFSNKDTFKLTQFYGYENSLVDWDTQQRVLRVLNFNV
jgi:hypothetical protein